MDENNIIICENCYEENEKTRTTCKKCGVKLYRQEELKNESIREERTENEDIRDKMMEHFTNTNKVALTIKVIAIVGVVLGIIYGCTLFDSAYTEDLGVIYIVVSIISAVFVYALGEIIQKLQNIEDNTRK